MVKRGKGGEGYIQIILYFILVNCLTILLVVRLQMMLLKN